MTRKGLEEIGAEFFLFLHDDYWLTDPVRTSELLEYVEYIRNDGIAHIQLVPSWDVMASGGVYARDPRLHWVSRESHYRTSNQASLWRVSSYLGLLHQRESAWQFEWYGNWRSLNLRCLCLAPDCIDWPLRYVYRHLPGWRFEPVVKGRWKQAAVDYCIREGLEYDGIVPDSSVVGG